MTFFFAGVEPQSLRSDPAAAAHRTCGGDGMNIALRHTVDAPH